jgi:LysM repeat protein
MYRIVKLGVAVLFLAVLLTGCVLSGSEPAPLPDETGGGVEVVPVDATLSPLDEIATQTAMAPPPAEEAEVVEVEPVAEEPAAEEPVVVEPVEEAAPVEEQPAEEGGIVEEPAAEIPTEEEEVPAEAATETPPTAEPAAAGDTTCPPTHTVQTGENLYRIALKYGLTYQELASANGIANANQVTVGTVLNIPGCGTGAGAAPTGTTGTYTVKAGDNLYRIALNFGVTYQELAAYNNITDPTVLVVGQVLNIPPSE